MTPKGLNKRERNKISYIMTRSMETTNQKLKVQNIHIKLKIE
jgi:hypothetical protein